MLGAHREVEWRARFHNQFALYTPQNTPWAQVGCGHPLGFRGDFSDHAPLSSCLPQHLPGQRLHRILARYP